jgi:hypothetical protein
MNPDALNPTTWDSVFARRVLGMGLLGAFAVLLLGHLGGRPMPIDGWTDDRYVWLLLVVIGATLGGLALRQSWARWLGIALGLAGAASAGLNLVPLWDRPGAQLGLALALTGGSALLAVALAGGTMAESDRRGPLTAMWRSDAPVVGWLRGAILSGFVAVPMLVVYGWMQPGSIASLRNPAVVLAGFLAVATAASVRGKVGGALMLALGGVALAVLGVAAFTAASIPLERTIAGYYLVFWVPAAGCAVISGCRVAHLAFQIGPRR